MQRHFIFTLHPLSTVIFATATVLAFLLLRNSSFNFHCYTQREATPTQKSARKCAATSRDFFAERLQSAFTLANQLRSIAQSPKRYTLHHKESALQRVRRTARSNNAAPDSSNSSSRVSNTTLAKCYQRSKLVFYAQSTGTVISGRLSAEIICLNKTEREPTN